MLLQLGFACAAVLVVLGCATGEDDIDDPGFSSGGAGNDAGEAGAGAEAGFPAAGGSSFGGTGGSSFGGTGGSSFGGTGGSSFGGTGGSSFGGSGGSSFGGSGGTGGTGGSGFGGTGGGSGGTGGSTTCTDPGPEPNDTEAAAVNKPEINDCDGSGASISGTLSGSGDADWFKYQGDDDVFCSVNPSATSNAVNVGARLCAFADCGGSTELKSCKKGSADFSPSGRKGCCTSTGTEVELEINCPGTSEDSAMIYIRIDQPNGNACIPYTIGYHY